MKIAIMLTLAALFGVIQSYAQLNETIADSSYSNRPGWIVTYGACPDQQVTAVEAQRIAREEARKRAIDVVCGVQPISYNAISMGALDQSVTLVLPVGLIVGEVLLRDGATSQPPPVSGYPYVMVTYWVELACSVACPQNLGKNSLDLRVALDRYTYRNGEACSLEIMSYHDGFLSVFCRDAKGGLARLVPNSLVPEMPIRAGEVVKFPDSSHPQRKYVQFKLTTFPGDRENQEALWVVVTRSSKPFLGGVGKGRLTRITLGQGIEADVIRDPVAATEEFLKWFHTFEPDDITLYPCPYRVVAE
jgi:hypothetical protein